MSPEQTFEIITAEVLLDRVQALRQAGYRLVQIGATRLPEQVELTYSFDRDGRLANLRLQVPATAPRLPSISPIYWCAFLYENELHDLFGLQVDNLAVDFHGNLYKTTVKFPFGSTKPPVAKAQPKAAPAFPTPSPLVPRPSPLTAQPSTLT
jgi:ech hydrogenase subunit D